jgi:deazaflavin-dependent oxidoreductase (nitroreductase family)
MAEYNRPGFMANLGNGFIGLMNRIGLRPGGSQLLAVRGRKSGNVKTTPVNPLTVDGVTYLVAPRGETHWVRNLRAANQGELRVGRTSTPIRTEEVGEAEKPALIGAYLQRWGSVTKGHFGATSANPPAAELEQLAGRTPVFRVVS